MTVATTRPASSLSATGRRVRLAVVGGLTGVTGLLAAVDPDTRSGYPLCPSRSLLGLDCPACGGLRGTHALLHGRVAEALDHNLLLPFILTAVAAGLALWLLPLVGREAPRLRLPPWLLVAAGVVLAGFTVARNLPIDSLDYLASEAA